MMKARIVLFFCFVLVCGLGFGQQAGFPLRFWGEVGVSGNVDRPVEKIESGYGSTFVILDDGTVVGWGENSSGITNVPSDIKNVVDISATYHALALLRDGTIRAWGNNRSNQCNIPIGLSDIVSISAGTDHSLALRYNGTVVAWGDGSRGQCSVPSTLSNVISIAAGSNFSAALSSDGTVVLWGDNTNGQCNIPAGLSNVTSIACGRSHVLALKSDTVVAWGYNYHGQCNFNGNTGVSEIDAKGDVSIILSQNELVATGNMYNGIQNIPSGVSSPRYFSIGLSHCCVLTSDRRIVCWGSNDHGESDVPQSLENIKKAYPLYAGVLVLKNDGTMARWSGMRAFRPIYALPVITNVEDISIGVSHFLALKKDSTVFAWGDSTSGGTNVPSTLRSVIAISAGNGHSLALKSNGTIVAWGNNTFGTCNVPQGITDFVSVSAGGDNSLALRANGTVVAWGNNAFGQCNVPASLSNVVSILAEGYSSIALKSNGTIVVWGHQDFIYTLPQGLKNIVSIGPGGSGVVALKYDGSAVTWGPVQYGSLSKFLDGPFSQIKAGVNVVAISGRPESQGAYVLGGKILKNRYVDCRQDLPERAVGFTAIKAVPGLNYGFTDSIGNYTIQLDSGTYQVSQVLSEDQALHQRQICPPNNAGYTASFAGRIDTVSGLNFDNEEIECPRLEVQVSSNRRRRCFKNSTTIKYSNSGFAGQPDVVAHLKLPHHVVLKSSSVANAFNAADSSYSFNLGNLAAGQSGQINILDSVVCGDGISGLQQCTKAWLTSYLLPCQLPFGYDGSNIDVRGKCVSNVPQFKIKNLWQTMRVTRSYRVYADTLLAYRGTYNLAAGDSTVLSFPGLASTTVLRLEAELDSFSPYGRFAYDLASCGPILTSIGDAFSSNTGNPVEATDCQEIRNSYDPNDKQVFPKGVSAAGNIEPGTWLTYRLRFINKGNDTAYMVRIVDTLSNDLDLGSLQFGASSHPFLPKISGKGQPVLTLIFDPINLPDSARSGQAAASGFVDFRIRASSAAPIGTQIKNHADILFDFNPRVRTNTVLNTLYRPTLTPGVIDTVLITNTRKPSRPLVTFRVLPNPSSGLITLSTAKAGMLLVVSAEGKSIQMQVQKGSNTLDLRAMPEGLYLLRLNGSNVRWVRE